jgi:hypothetical protein
MQKVTNFFLYCSGSDMELLSQSKTEINKYVGIGATVFFTGVFASISAGYALYTVFDSWIIASVFGFIWGLMIFNLDRYIVSSMRKEGRVGREFLVALPRIILAVLISIVIVKPLELKIFDKEIQPELIVMEQQKYKQQEGVVRTRFSSAQDSLKNELNRLKSEIAVQASRRDDLVRIAQEEADGTGGSKKKNLGPIYKIKKADADNAAREFANVAATNNAKIAALENIIERNDANLNGALLSVEHPKINGPAARIEALDRLTDESSAIWWAHWFIILLFIAIETAPVFVKLISSRGPYDNLLKIEENAFFISETEILAKTHADARQRGSTLSQHEQAFVNRRLDASLKRS